MNTWPQTKKKPKKKKVENFEAPWQFFAVQNLPRHMSPFLPWKPQKKPHFMPFWKNNYPSGKIEPRKKKKKK